LIEIKVPIAILKPNVMLVNTSIQSIIDPLKAVIL